MKKKRLDVLLIEYGNASTKEEALKMIIAGDVLVQGQKAVSPAQMFESGVPIEVRGRPPFVGRGGEKLAHAVKEFHIDAAGKIALDVGAATGGFTDVLLQHGAKKVYALDTAKGKLDVKLREDPRVIIMEGTNIIGLKTLPDLADIISIDVSLTSLRNVFPQIKKFLRPGGDVLALFKPQYEIEDKRFLRHGIIEDSAARQQTLDDFLAWVAENNWHVLEYIPSPIKGSEGNTEYLLHVRTLGTSNYDLIPKT